jgi:acyl carrier protein
LEGAAPVRRALDEIERRCDEQEITDPLAQSRLGGFALQRRTILRGLSARGEPLAVDAIVIAEQDGGGEARSMEFGPRWHSLQRVKLGAREGLALLELPPAFEADLQAYQLHPALLDFATSFLRLFKSKGSYLPLSYKRLRMKGPLPGRVYSYVRFKDDAPTPQGVTLRFDVTLLDEQGTELVEIEEFAVMRIDDVGKLGALSRTPVLLQDGGPDARTELLAEDLRGGLSSAEGVEVFERVLGSALPRVVVSARDLPTRIAAGRAYSAALLAGAAQGDATSKVKHPRPKLMNAFAPPRNETEQKLAGIWQDVLGIKQVGVHDNFFELGGDSLLVTQIHSRFVESFGTDVSVANLLQYPTIADLAQFLSEQDGAQEPSFEQVHQRTSQQKEAMKRRRQKMKKRS